MVSDYLTRMTLRKAGIVQGFDELDCFEVHCFCIIAGELSKMEAEEQKKAARKRGK